MKFGRVVGSGRSRRRRRSGRRAKKGFDKVEMEAVGGGEAGDQKTEQNDGTREALARPSFPSCIQ